MKNYTYFVLFSIDSDKFAIPYEKVIEATKSVEITTLPYQTKRLNGIINFHGKIIPVVNIRKIMMRPEKQLSISDSFIMLTTSDNSMMAIIADSVHELIKPESGKITDIESILPDYDLYEGTIKSAETLIPIINTDKLMSKKEKAVLESTNLTT